MQPVAMSGRRLLRLGIPVGAGAALAALGFVVADHGFAAIAIALWCLAAVGFAVGAIAVVLDAHTEGQRMRAEREQERRAAILKQLRQRYLATHSGDQALSIITGMARVPKPWMDAQLEAMGETWRLDNYR